MKIIEQSVEILQSKEELLAMHKRIEEAGRTCYKSENLITEDSYIKFINMIKNHAHFSVIEHSLMSVRFITNRAIANEITRHRIASYSQESTRYCNYSKDKFANELTFILPIGLSDDEKNIIIESYKKDEATYLKLIEIGTKPEVARDILPLGLKTELVMSANFRTWLHFFEMRSSSGAHPQIRHLVQLLKNELKDLLIFN